MSNSIQFLVDRLDRALASNTYRHGCAYKAPAEQCDHCRPIITLRDALTAYWREMHPIDTLWWEDDPQRRPGEGDKDVSGRRP